MKIFRFVKLPTDAFLPGLTTFTKTRSAIQFVIGAAFQF